MVFEQYEYELRKIKYQKMKYILECILYSGSFENGELSVFPVQDKISLEN